MVKGNGKTPPPPAASVTGWDDERHVQVRQTPVTPSDHFDFHTSNLENEAQARDDRIRELTAEIRAMERRRKTEIRWYKEGGIDRHVEAYQRNRRVRLFLLACVLAAVTVAGVAYVS
jgi:hypothetical protein